MLGSVKVSRVSFKVSVSISVSISLPRLIWYEDIFFSLLTDSRWKDYISSSFDDDCSDSGLKAPNSNSLQMDTSLVMSHVK